MVRKSSLARRSKRMRVLLKKPAFLSIVLAAMETFKKECFGFVLGKIDEKGFVIEHSVAMQTAKRKFSSVENVGKREKTILDVCDLFWKSSRVVGDFHSHPHFKTTDLRDMSFPSKADTNGSFEGNVYFIVDIATKKREQRWKVTKDGGISGSLGNFKLKIKAFRAPEDKKLESVKISCPIIYKLNVLKK